MSFFGRVLTSVADEQVEIPPGFTLTLLMASLVNGRDSRILVRVGSQSETFFQLASLCGKDPNCPIQAEFSHGDSPLELRVIGDASIHVTGRYGYDEAAVDDEEKAEEEIALKEVVKKEIKKDVVKKGWDKSKKRKGEDTSSSSSSGKLSRTEAKKARKQEREEEESINARLQEYANTSSAPVAALSLSAWKVKPEGDEGVVVPNPSQVSKQGVLCTDYIVGKGKVPRLGATVKVIYEGMFSNGKTFDKNLKRSKPLSFRKGAGQVVRGMDIGIENMRVGGSREIVIPSHLGYVPF